MKTYSEEYALTASSIDSISEKIGAWLEDVKESKKNVIRMRLLNTFAGFMMFICIINGICGIGTVGEFNKIGRKMIGRYLGLSIAVTIGILMDFFLTGARVGILQMELALQARAFGMLDVEMLRSRQD